MDDSGYPGCRERGTYARTIDRALLSIMRPHPRHADTDPRVPRAWATCDRCGEIWNHYKLEWQYEWGAKKPYNTRILVCEYCRDEMQEQFKSIILPPDPLPIVNPRPE